jgi:cytochrome b561
VLLVLPFRCYLYRKTIRELGKAYSSDKSLYLLPWKDFMADLLAWLVAGMLMAAVYLIYFKAPIPTGARILFTCLCFGLFGGMLSLLSTEKRIIAWSKTIKLEAAPPPPKRIFSVSNKMILFFVITLLIMAITEAAILFCDLRGYTSFVERKDPEEVVRSLNAYFTEMHDVIRRYNGIVLQYIGDEIEAMFGAPVHEPNHSEMAILAALEMRKCLEARSVSFMPW